MLSEQTATFALYNINSLVFIIELEGVCSAVRNESLYITDTVSSNKTQYTTLFSSLRVTRTNDCILLDLITRIIFGQEHKLSTVKFPPVSSTPPSRPKHLHQYSVLEHPQPMFLPQCERPSFTPT
jgi:hypothetical protein